MGYVTLENVFNSNLSHLEIALYVYLCYRANFSDAKWKIQGNEFIDIKRGEFITTEQKLAEALCATRNSLRRALKTIESLGIIERKPHKSWTKIVIVNFEGNEIVPVKTHSARTPNEHQIALSKEGNKVIKKEERGKQPSVAPSRSSFQRPTAEEVRSYGLSVGFGVDAAAFLAHYDSNGWMVGRTPMKDWKAAVRTWKARAPQFASSNASPAPVLPIWHENIPKSEEIYDPSEKS